MGGSHRPFFLLGYSSIPWTRAVRRDRSWHGNLKLLILNGGRGGNRTHNPRLRRPVLYPIELLAREWSGGGRGAGCFYCSQNGGRKDSFPVCLSVDGIGPAACCVDGDPEGFVS